MVQWVKMLADKTYSLSSIPWSCHIGELTPACCPLDLHMQMLVCTLFKSSKRKLNSCDLERTSYSRKHGSETGVREQPKGLNSVPRLRPSIPMPRTPFRQ